MIKIETFCAAACTLSEACDIAGKKLENTTNWKKYQLVSTSTTSVVSDGIFRFAITAVLSPKEAYENANEWTLGTEYDYLLINHMKQLQK